MSAKEIYAERAQEEEKAKDEHERRSSRRFVIILGTSILLLFALTVGALYLIFNSTRRPRVPPARSVATGSSESATANEKAQADSGERMCG